MDLVLQPRELRILEGLRLAPRRKFAGSVRGERTTQSRGISIEFADYREYAEGDDLRHLDWNVLARLGHAVTKTYRDEEDLAVYVLLDGSASMGFGEPSKFETAKALACAVGYVALSGGDSVLPWMFSTRSRPSGSMRGRVAYPRLANWATSTGPEGQRAFDAELKQFAAGRSRPGVAVVVSDALHPQAVGALRSLAGRGHEVWLLQVLSDVELEPDLEGDLRLIDVETGAKAELTVNSFTLREYRERLKAHTDALAEECRRSGGRYAQVVAGERIDRLVKDVLKREGWME
ncbi:MAG: DUF58 domain-containing protein [Armatimonadetes bacterium]|nr:DUF58 domain-containing protein [Armatimonadota bacterium]